MSEMWSEPLLGVRIDETGGAARATERDSAKTRSGGGGGPEPVKATRPFLILVPEKTKTSSVVSGATYLK